MGRRIDLHADAGRRFVHDVDGLVRQVAVGNVPRRQFDGCFDGFVSDAGLVEGFVAVAQAEEDSHGVVFRRFADQDGLEAAGQGGIFFKVFLIFVDSRGADALQIATGQGRFEDISRIHGAFDGTSPDELMDFVDKEDDRVVLFNRVEDTFDPFFKFTTVLGTGDDTGQIEEKMRLSSRLSGTLPVMMRWARPSAMAVLPTPGAPMRTGLFLVRRLRIWMTRLISFSCR